MPLARAGDVTLEYFVQGPERAKHQILLVHGWTYGARMWVRFQTELAERGVRSIAVNSRGMGASQESPREEDYTTAQFAIDLKNLADGLGLDRYHLAGQCMGGTTCMRFVDRYREPVQSLILIGAPSKPHPPDDRPAFLDWVERYPASTSRAAFDTQTRGLSPEERERLYHDWTHIPKARLRGARLIETEDLAPVLRALTVPSLYCFGDRDTTVPMKSSLMAFQALPERSRSLHVFHGAEHMLPCLVPRQLAEVVHRFLEERPLFDAVAP